VSLSFLNPLFEAVAWVMMRIHAVLAVPFGASSGLTWALSIIILVVLMRLVMVPLFIKQRNSMLKMQSHMPQLRELQKRYKGDKTRLNEETMKFYKENGINPLGGCLPLVAQLPVFWALFNVLKAIAQWTPPAAGQAATQPKYGMTVPFVESAHNARIFGISLYDQFLHPAAGETLTSRLLIVVFVLISAGTTFLTMRQSQKRGMMNQPTPDPDQPGAAAAQAMSKNMMYIAPFFALTGLYWQFGLVLYWVTTNVWTLGQQHFLFRRLPVVGSATVGASAVQAASGSSATAVKSGSAPAKAASARPASARPVPSKSASAKAVPAKTGTAKAVPAKTGTAAAKPAVKSGTSSSSSPSAAKAKVQAANGVPRKAPAAKADATAKAQDTVQPQDTVEPQDTVPVQDTAKPVSTSKAGSNGAVNGASVGAAGSSSPSRGLLRFGKAKPEPEPEPVAPPTKIARQQPVRQTRSRRSGNSGKR
jgi:YidC/Oxa1 family membrane protein insertase